ncbi:cysteine hydrolase [Brevibacillus fluminis]|uniref:Cysteine hydrolase n=1 Tax=Brevibacillus fluminis TaxID=511487 RepID=A0A3M8CUV0_9BACL|nr:cysteine hydrolase family protein [Brevibacillus fluminis]RNB79592.1 cysteine hydrolase [Brevibacillus fluminis]
MDKKTALLVIDTQIGIIDGPKAGPVHKAAALVSTIRSLIEQARTRSVPVLYVQDVDVAPLDALEFQIHPELAPLAGEVVVVKKATDAFVHTNLHDVLQTMEINHLVIVGCKTEYCIDSAVRRATTLGYDVTLVRDGHSTTDSEALQAEQIVAHHNACLHGLYNIDNFVIVRDSGETVFEPIHDTYR